MTEYHFPPIELLKDSSESSRFQRLEYVQHLKDALDGMFTSFRMDAKVVDYRYNNFAILLKVKLGKDVTPKQIRKLRQDVELHLANPVEFLDGAGAERQMTIAVKHLQRPIVPLKDVLQSNEFREAESPVMVAAGIDLFGSSFTFDIASMPNLLVAGTTGSGKSVFLHDIILSILYKAHPKDVKLLLFDMKGIEFPLFNGLPHMLRDAVVDTETGLAVLKWLQNEKNARLYKFMRTKTENIEEYNAQASEPLPRILMIMDEYMEYVRRKRDEDEERLTEFNAIIRDLAHNASNTGIHLILATQCPSDEEVITPEIKELLPCRASFVVVDKRESRIVLNRTGAERLLGQGDMIFTRNDSGEGIHAQAAFVSDEEINQVIGFLRNEAGLYGTEPIVSE